MAKKITISLLAIILVASLCLSLIGCSTEYGNRPIKLKYGADNSVARLTGDRTAEALKFNPDRGFAIDAYMTLDETNGTNHKTTYAFPSSCGHSEHMDNGEAMKTQIFLDKQLKRYEAYNPRVIVMTVYLTNFSEKELTGSALDQLFNMIRAFRTGNLQNMSLVLKFAYQHIDTDPVPSAEMVTKHMAKIGELFESNVSSISGLVSAIRLSFVGIDGNFENNPYNEADTQRIIDGFAMMIPTKYAGHTEAPNVGTKNKIAKYESLINMGFYNNHIDGSMNTFVSGGTDKKSDAYKQYVYQSEANYNSAGISPNMANIDGKAVLKMMKDGYFTTLDLASIASRNGGAESLINSWSNTIISRKELDNLNLPYYDEWFLDKDGASQNRSVFDYLRDFLGYNLSITNLKFEKFSKIDPKDNKSKIHTKITFVLTNYGMAAPLHIDNFEMYIKNNATGGYIQGGKGLVYPTTYDPKLLVSGGQIEFSQLVIGDIDVATITGGTSPKGHSIGIKMYASHSSRPQYVRLSNDVPYTDNINWIYSTENK